MKKNVLRGFKSAMIIFCCGIVFFGSAYAYLSYCAKKQEQTAQAKEENIPYSKAPEDTGLLLRFPEGNGVFVYLSFENGTVRMLWLSDESDLPEQYGYSADHSLMCNGRTVSGFVDCVGGIEWKDTDGESLRFTGVQIEDMLASGKVTEKGKKEIMSAVMSAISKDGIDRSDLVFLIENSDTDLTVPDCFEWPEQLPDMCGRAIWITSDDTGE